MMPRSVAIVADRTFKNGTCYTACSGGGHWASAGQAVGRREARGAEEAGRHCRIVLHHGRRGECGVLRGGGEANAESVCITSIWR